MSKTRKRMLLSSLVMLIVAAMALASVTYAWFTTSKTANVTNVQFTAKAAEGIQLSATNANGSFKGTLTSADIVAATTETGNPQENAFAANGTLVPVSTVGAVSDGKMVIYKGAINESDKLVSSSVTEGLISGTEYNFYKFNIYIKNVGGSPVTISLDQDGNTVSGGDSSTGIENAARIAFVDRGSTTAAEPANPTSAVIWEPNSDSHVTESRDTTNYTTLGIKATGTLETTNKATGTGSEPYFVATEEGKVETQPTVTTASSVVVCNNIAGNTTEKVTVYIWLEGQDIDCGNAESGGAVFTNLRFIATPYVAPVEP